MSKRARPIRPAEIGRLLIAPLVAILLVLAGAGAEAAEPEFPTLAGRVTDAAGLLSPEARHRIEDKLKTHEDKTSDQVVVATVPSLQGLTVEDYGNRLFRTWKLGDKPRNNGVLLLVAPKEHKVRIEVGYGLEGALTDALSKVIITTAITPKFKQGDFAGGIEAGIDAILSILTGDAEEWHRRAKVRGDEMSTTTMVIGLVFFIMLAFLIYRASVQSGWRRGGGFVILPGPSGGWSGGFSGGGGGFSDSGGFAGGGGSSGGGGASGDW